MLLLRADKAHFSMQRSVLYHRLSYSRGSFLYQRGTGKFLLVNLNFSE